ncbi:MAG: hypothetical protein ACK55I_32225, partial [bacterium]
LMILSILNLPLLLILKQQAQEQLGRSLPFLQYFPAIYQMIKKYLLKDFQCLAIHQYQLSFYNHLNLNFLKLLVLTFHHQ